MTMITIAYKYTVSLTLWVKTAGQSFNFFIFILLGIQPVKVQVNFNWYILHCSKLCTEGELQLLHCSKLCNKGKHYSGGPVLTMALGEVGQSLNSIHRLWVWDCTLHTLKKGLNPNKVLLIKQSILMKYSSPWKSQHSLCTISPTQML